MVKHDTKLIFKTFEKRYSSLSRKLLEKLPKPLNRYAINFLLVIRKDFAIFPSCKLGPTFEDTLLNLLKNIKVKKRNAGIDQISGNFLKNGAQRLSVRYAKFLRH